ncbi:MAG: hypothetical protein HC870_01235 [Rhizobiales bacterium]|nr:hypothetical protein [Hyphomicrobiales bacterium]
MTILTEMAMVTVHIELSEDKLVDCLDAIRKFSPAKLRIFAEQPVPPSPMREAELQKLAHKIALAIAPRPEQQARRDALKLVLEGGDTFTSQEGEADPALRNATGAISKSLRRFDPVAQSPLDLLCERRREVFSRGPHKGNYKGMRYIPTALGQRVLRKLKELGML